MSKTARKATRPPGRPTTYTDAIGEKVAMACVMKSLHAVCQAKDMPAESTVYLWLVRCPEFSEKYARAREARAFRRAEGVDDIADKVRAGLLDPAAGRMLLDAIKWQTAKENPKSFGERLIHDGKVAMTLEQLVAAQGE